MYHLFQYICAEPAALPTRSYFVIKILRLDKVVNQLPCFALSHRARGACKPILQAVSPDLLKCITKVALHKVHIQPPLQSVLQMHTFQLIIPTLPCPSPAVPLAAAASATWRQPRFHSRRAEAGPPASSSRASSSTCKGHKMHAGAWGIYKHT